MENYYQISKQDQYFNKIVTFSLKYSKIVLLTKRVYLGHIIGDLFMAHLVSFIIVL